MRMKQDTILMEEIWMGAALLWSLQEGDHEELLGVELENIWEEALPLGLGDASIVAMMAIGLETVKLGIGKINVIAVVSGVILKETVKTVQNQPGVSGLFQDHLPGHCRVVVEEAVVQVTTAEVAATVDPPDHQGQMAVVQFRMKRDQEVEVTATVLGGQGDKAQKWMVVGAAVLQLTMQVAREAVDIVQNETVAGVTVQH